MSKKSLVQTDNAQTIALELTNRISTNEKLGETSTNFRKDFLDLYAECFQAASGYRDMPEQK